LALHLDNEGRLERTEIAKSSGYKILDDAALETVKSYKFSPAVDAGKNVSAVKRLTIKFVLEPPKNLAGKANFQFIGTWEGSLEGNNGSHFSNSVGRQLKVRIVIIAQNDVSVFFLEEDKWVEINHGLFKIAQWGPHALLVSISSGDDQDGTWVESFSSTLAYIDDNTIVAYWLRTVSNISLPTTDKNYQWARSFSGALNRVSKDN